jgi:two-component system, cell cycle sensor histidine kinase and response regulator CckA
MTDSLRVLLVEDSATDAKLIARTLGRSFGPVEIERVETGAAMRAALEAGSTWDVIISDWSMPTFTALEALEVATGLAPDLPVIIVSGTIGEESAVEAMRAGARDFFLKDKLARLAAAISREVGESKRRMALHSTEEALHASEARFARLSESGIIGIVIADVSGNLHSANDAYLTMLGYTRAEVQSGLPRWVDVTPVEWRPADDLATQRLLDQGTTPAYEKEMIRKDGRRVPVLVGGAMLDGQKCIMFATDLSERKNAEEALCRTEEQLRQSQKMEAIGVLAGGVAHDFNNILTVILSYSEMLAMDLQAGDPMLADLREIRQAGQRAAALTRQLLSFSRQQAVEPQVIDLNAIIEEMDKMLRRLIREDIELATVPEPGLGRCWNDVGQIQQIVMNLVVNARDAMPTGGKLTVETANVELDEAFARTHFGVNPGQYVMLAVSDTGVGMDKATQARIFEPFFTTKETGKGTGLGLSTVFGIVKQSGGTIWVYSEPSRGTSFKVYLPRTNEVARPEASETPITTLHGSETILLVEDEVQIRKVAKGILARHGYRVIESQSASDALLICDQHKGTIDLLLTDVIMPQMSGSQLAERMTAARPAMKVLFMSGYTDGAITGRLAPGVAFLQKPLTPGTLTRKVREVLGSPAPPPSEVASRREQVDPGPMEAAAKGRILLVDDDPSILRTMQRPLENAGYEVVTAPGGLVAIEMLKRRKFDAVVSDLSMPGMTGIDLLRAVREQDLDISFLIVTGTPDVKSATSAIEYGALRYLVKPVLPSELGRNIEYAVQMSRMARVKREALFLVGDAQKFVGDRAGLETRFSRALAGIWMAYQPIVSWSSKRVHAHEALVRGGSSFGNPGVLLAAAETLGRLPDLGAKIRKSVAGTASTVPGKKLFVNLHTLDLNDEALFSADAPLSRFASDIVLEITERASLDDVGVLPTRLKQLRDMGYQIALDDLGAGYSGLTSLARLQPEVVKLDMSLVRDIDRDATKQKLVGTMVRLAGEMGMAVVVEGVETVGERDALVMLGCDLFQGFLFARPDRPFPSVDW